MSSNRTFLTARRDIFNARSSTRRRLRAGCRYLSALVVILLATICARAQTPTYANNGHACANSELSTYASNVNLLDYTCPLPHPTTAHNVLVAMFRYRGKASVSSVTDDTGDLFALAAGTNCDDSTAGVKVAIYVALDVNGGATFVRFTPSTGTEFVHMVVLEFANVVGNGAVDQGICSDTGAGSASTSVSAGTLSALAGTGELVIQYAAGDNNATTSGWSTATQGGCAWKLRSRQILDTIPTASQFCVDSTTTSFAPTITSGSSIKSISAAVALKPATLGRVPSGPLVAFIQSDNNTNEQATSVSVQVDLFGNGAEVLADSGCNTHAPDCQTTTAVSDGGTNTYSLVNTNGLSSCGTSSSDVDIAASILVAKNTTPGDYTLTETGNGRSTGGNGGTWYFFDLVGVDTSNLVDTTIGTSGLGQGQVDQQGASSAPLTPVYTVTPARPFNEFITTILGLNWDTPNLGFNSPSFPNKPIAENCYYTGILNTSHCDLNSGLAILYPTSTASETWTWTVDDSSARGAGCTMALSVGFLGLLPSHKWGIVSYGSAPTYGASPSYGTPTWVN